MCTCSSSDMLSEVKRKLDERAAELKAQGFSGRKLIYLDFKRGLVVEGGEVEVAKPWTEVSTR